MSVESQLSGAEIAYYDPHLPEVGPTREHMAWCGVQSIDWGEQSVRGFDATVIVTAHGAIDYHQLLQWSKCVVDTRNALRSAEGDVVERIYKA
ncbi:MAG TPA: UDP binding domain-containing protein [Chthoniobacterales bacterium]|nr:UDP binding domain-containing protein [Chthoniobacterales bacterium]